MKEETRSKEKERINFWVYSGIKKKYKNAAEAEGLSLTKWLIVAANERIKRG